MDDSRRAARGACLILTAAAAADPDRADDHPVAPQRNAACEDHDPYMIGVLDSVELLAWLAVLREGGSRDAECARGIWLIEVDVDAAYPRAVHPHMAHQIAAGVDHGNIHGLADLACLGFRCSADVS